MYTDPSGHAFIIDDILIGMAIGAAIGGTTSAATGGDIGMGMLTGAISGAIFGGAGSYISSVNSAAQISAMDAFYTASAEVSAGLSGAAQAGIHGAAGALSGGINSGITGGNVGQGALVGGISGSIGSLGAPNFKPFGGSAAGSIGNQLFNSGLTGAGFGAAYAGVTGDDIGQGAARGGLTWAAGAAGNMLIGHAIGFVGSGFKAPTPQAGVFIYEGNPWGHLTIGNVIWASSAGMSPSEFIHEQTGHGTFQANLLGPAYLPAHILDKMTFSLMLEYSKPLLGGAPTYYDLYSPQDRPWTWWSIFN